MNPKRTNQQVEPFNMPYQEVYFLNFEVFHSIDKLVTQLNLHPTDAIYIFTNYLSVLPEERESIESELTAFYNYPMTQINCRLDSQGDHFHVFYLLHAGVGILKIREITRVGQPRIVEIRDNGLQSFPTMPHLRVDWNHELLQKARKFAETLNTLEGNLIPMSKLPTFPKRDERSFLQ